MNLSPVTLAIPIFFMLMAVEIIFESITKRQTYRLNDAITNISTGTIQQVAHTFMHILKIGIYTLLYERFAFFQIEATWMSFIALFVLYDLSYYWEHRVAHTVSLFWGGHSVHHQSEDYNLSVALRQSSTAILWGFPFALPLALMGFDPVQLTLVAGFNLLYQFWIHTEHINKMGVLEWVMNTPSHHRVHHGRNPKYIDKNYAGVFIIWDRFFGTFQEEEERPDYGITVPLSSWNPVYANFAHYIHLYQVLRQTNTWSERWKVLFRGPGYIPAHLEYIVEEQKIKSGYQKYNANPTTPWLNAYVFVQFLGSLAIAPFFLFNYKTFDFYMVVCFALWIMVTTTMFGFLFERRNNWITVVELLRLLVIPIGVYGFIQSGDLPSWSLIGASIFALGSIIFYFYAFHKRNTTSVNS